MVRSTNLLVYVIDKTHNPVIQVNPASGASLKITKSTYFEMGVYVEDTDLD